MQWTPAQIEAATRARVRSGRALPPGGLGPVVADSRQATPGCLFVPIRADRDGHRFIPAAVDAGAAGFLCDPASGLFAEGESAATRRGPRRSPESGAWSFEVADTGRALLDLGGAARDRLADRVVGITGSVGKTSTKDLTAAALATRWKVTASAHSFNNELGVPLTLANASPDTEVTVVEMGARGPGHIALLCRVARPTVAVVTAVAAVHTELFGDLRSIARAKGELVEALPADGTAVLNADDPAVAAMSDRTDAAVVSYGLRPGAEVVATDVRLDADLRPTFMLRSPWGSLEVRPAVRGEHQVANVLAAAAVALTWDVPLAAVADGLARAELSPWRMQLEHTAGGAAVLNDAYNANPTSMAAALRALAALEARRRVAVIGEMAELGPIAADEHRRIAALASELGIQVLAVGTSLYGPGAVAGPAQAAAVLGPLGPDDAVLVKASRVAGLERLAELLCRPGPGA